MGDVLVVAEHSNGKVRSASYEVLGVAERLAEKTSGSVSAILVGDKLQGLDKLLASYGAHKVYLVESSDLGVYSTEGHCAAVCKVIEEAKPEMDESDVGKFGEDLLSLLLEIERTR